MFVPTIIANNLYLSDMCPIQYKLKNLKEV